MSTTDGASEREMTPQDILARIQHSLRRHESPPPPAVEGGLGPELASLQSSADVYHPRMDSDRPFMGRALLLARRAVRRLLIPVLGQQVTYNLTNARVVARLKQDLDAIAQRQEDLLARLEQVADEAWSARGEVRRACTSEVAALGERYDRDRQQLGERIAEMEQTLREQVAETRQTLGGLVDGQDQAVERVQAEVSSLRKALQANSEQASRTDRALRRVVHDLTSNEGSKADPLAASPGPEFDYFGFEMRFRGSEDVIRRRQQPYVACFRGAASVLDLGCGRGEFLELLRDAGIAAKGVDTDIDMVLACRTKGLEVSHADAFRYLDGLPDESLGGVFSAQVVEHLDSTQMMNLIRLCQRKLRTGATIILETINLQCASGMNAFYLDPSHVRPVHPEMLRFFLESIGFADTTVRYSPDTSDIDVSTMTDEWCRTYCPDYAVIAKK